MILTQDRSGKSMANAITAIKTKAFIRVVIDQNHGSAAMQFLIKNKLFNYRIFTNLFLLTLSS
jgi:hypothetical protein